MDNWPIPHGTVLNLQRIGVDSKLHNDQRLRCHLIGWQAGQSLIVSQPFDGHSSPSVLEGDDFVIRCLIGRSIYAFRAIVLKHAIVPYGYLHLTWPEKIDETRIREAERVAVNMAATVTNPALRPESFLATLTDLSVAGAKIDTEEDIGDVGALIGIEFLAPFNDQPYTIKALAKVCNTRVSNEGNSLPIYHRGVHFEGLGEQDLLYLRGFVLEQIALHRSHY